MPRGESSARALTVPARDDRRLATISRGADTPVHAPAGAQREPLERSLIGRMVLRFDIIDGSDRAAVLALNALLSLIPLAVLGVAIAHVYGITSGNYADGLSDVLNLHGRTAQYVHDASASVNESIRSATVVGIGGLLWTAFGFTSALWRDLRPRVGRPQPRRSARVAPRVRLAHHVHGHPRVRGARAERHGTQHVRRRRGARAAARPRIRRLARLAVAAARAPAAAGASSHPGRPSPPSARSRSSRAARS